MGWMFDYNRLRRLNVLAAESIIHPLMAMTCSRLRLYENAKLHSAITQIDTI